MINLDTALLSLLRKNQKASIAQLGTFTVKKTSAEIHPVNHTFSPPHAALFFEENTATDSNCLLPFITDAYKLNIAEATKLLNDYAETIKQNLSQNGKHVFEGIGTLKKENDTAYVFKKLPDVLLSPEHIGLTEFVSQAIKRNKKEQHPIVKPKRKRKYKWLIAATLCVLIIALTTASYFVFPDFVKPYVNTIVDKAQNITDNLFKKEEKTSEVIINKEKEAKESQEKPSASIKKKPKIAEQTEIQEEAVPESLPEAKEKTVTHKTSSSQYYIVAGSFKNLENAENYAKQLQSGEYPSALMLPEPRKGFYTVVFAGFNDRGVAEKELLRINNKENANYWIINN